MKKIVYLHGLESNPGGPKVSFLAEKGMVYTPTMDYHSLDLHEFILTLGMPDLIIGSSMGGYIADMIGSCLLYTSPSPRDRQKSRMPSSA